MIPIGFLFRRTKKLIKLNRTIGKYDILTVREK